MSDQPSRFQNHGVKNPGALAAFLGRRRKMPHPMRMADGGAMDPPAPATMSRDGRTVRGPTFMAGGGMTPPATVTPSMDQSTTPDINGDVPGIETNMAMKACPDCGGQHMCHGGTMRMAEGGEVPNMVGGRGPGMTAANGRTMRGNESQVPWDGGTGTKQQPESFATVWSRARNMQGR